MMRPGTTTADEARCDIRVRGFTRQGNNTFMYIQITSLTAEPHVQNTAAEVLKKAEDTKRRKYGDRIIQKMGPLFQ